LSRISNHFERSAARGFTLVEVTVTMTILGVILLIIFGVFRLGLSAWEKGESSKADAQKIRVVSQLISRQLKSAFPYKIKTEKAEADYLAFEGKPHSLKFVSALPMKAQRAEGLTFAIYEFEEAGGEGGRLILYEQRALNKDFMEEPPKKEDGVSLLENLADVSFEYYRAEDTEKTRSAEWLKEWSAKEEKELPKAIRMTVVEKKAGGRDVPIVIQATVPSNRLEELKFGPTRAIAPQRGVPSPSPSPVYR
jgi:general secretion pathway protein J